MRQFWNWIAKDEQRELYIDGPICGNGESWYDDEVEPARFRAELMNGRGPVKLHISSPGGDVFAAAQIYTMLMEYPDEVTVQIDSLAASAASVIAMAGTVVTMSPTAILMIHNPWTIALGDSHDMQQAAAVLDEVKETILNAYEIKTGLSRVKLSHMMDDETWMNAWKAKELGFCDEVLFADNGEGNSYAFSAGAVSACLNRIVASIKGPVPEITAAAASDEADHERTEPAEPTDNRVSVEELDKRLNRSKYI